MKCEAQALEREALEMRAAEELQAVNYAEWNYPLQIIERSFKKTAPLHDHLLAQAALYSEKIYGYVDSQFGRRDRFTLLSQLTALHDTVARDIAALSASVTGWADNTAVSHLSHLPSRDRRAQLPSKGQASTSQACRVAFTVY